MSLAIFKSKLSREGRNYVKLVKGFPPEIRRLVIAYTLLQIDNYDYEDFPNTTKASFFEAAIFFITAIPMIDVEIGKSDRIDDVTVYLDFGANLPKSCWLCIWRKIDKFEIFNQIWMFKLRKLNYSYNIPEIPNDLVGYMINCCSPQEVNCSFHLRDSFTHPELYSTPYRTPKITTFEIPFDGFVVERV
ncbi:unnamed protein product [Ambrosiozyma monospora]|uniref:Unnamed protein product n=1 Tax=Ambrosiozyma monospora TaxID=43982 RepID=A0A9W6SZR0_AMBMO|nr:unnamed protein product [Ambrosiozyma monospora]